MGNVVLKLGHDGTCRAVTCRTGDILLLSGNIGKGVVTGDIRVVAVPKQHAATIRISPGPDRITSRINVRIKGIK